MENSQILNSHSPNPPQSDGMENSPSVHSFGTVEDFKFSSDDSVSEAPSHKTLPKEVVATPRKVSNGPLPPHSPQVDSSPEQEFHRRNTSKSSRRTRYSTLISDFDSECVPTLVFHNHESGQFDFNHQTDYKFSDMMDCNEGNVFAVVPTDEETLPSLEHLYLGEEVQESDSLYFVDDAVIQNYHPSRSKSENIDGLEVSPVDDTLFPEKEQLLTYGGLFDSPKMLKFSEEYPTYNEELTFSPDYAEPISYVPMYEKSRRYSETKSASKSPSNSQVKLGHSLEEKMSEVSTPERNDGVKFEIDSNWIPVSKHHSSKPDNEIYEPRKTNSDDLVLRNYPKRAITMPRRAQSESWRTSEGGSRFGKFGSIALLSNLQFCSPCTPEKKRTDACIIM